MKRLLIAMPLALAACAPTISGPTTPLPLRAGQVWRYTIRENHKPPLSHDIRVNFSTGQESPSYTVRSPGEKITLSMDEFREGSLTYDSKYRRISAGWFDGNEVYFCSIGDVVESKKHFEGTLIIEGVNAGTCAVELR
ncbi:hypothetical protein DAERI_010539 [Deinococcus aerius]|uniref:Lipoprotein n=1 Tax=Deinococcus aerius TaxID=200253 RepID=A0A2I9DQA0_9DEIO|nr:hypothetical protein [Deinococcus aerius]GBF04367.1 hypothetical protein DAERI_010539 [Deinococcus aerius]